MLFLSIMMGVILVEMMREVEKMIGKHRAELLGICPNARAVLADGEVFSWYGSRLLKAVDYFHKLQSSIGLP